MPGSDEPLGEDGQLDEWLAFAPQEPGTRPRRRMHSLEMASVLIGVAVLLGLFLLRPTGAGRQNAIDRLSILGLPSQFHSAEVVAIDPAPCEFDPAVTCTTVDFLLRSGPDDGSTYTQLFTSEAVSPEFATGQNVVLSYRPPNGVVVGASKAPCEFDASADCTDLTVVVTMGDRSGERLTYQVTGAGGAFPTGSDVDLVLQDGPEGTVVVAASPADEATQYQFADYQRRGLLLWILIVFAAAVIALGR